jgi:hypothetical protein
LLKGISARHAVTKESYKIAADIVKSIVRRGARNVRYCHIGAVP